MIETRSVRTIRAREHAQGDAGSGGYGTICDAGLDENGVAHLRDLAILTRAFFTSRLLPGCSLPRISSRLPGTLRYPRRRGIEALAGVSRRHATKWARVPPVTSGHDRLWHSKGRNNIATAGG